MRAWHFLDSNGLLRDGRTPPEIGEWLVHESDVKLCHSGLHASVNALDALNYAPGAIACLVECEDIVEQDNDKLVCRRRRILGKIDATEILGVFGRECALSVLHNWQDPVPDVVKTWLETGDESLRKEAYSAADSAAWSAASSAAYSSAWSAADSAADSAAYSAAYSAANWAAYSAADLAARSAASSAAGPAAWSAAYWAVRSAAWSDLNTMLESMLLTEMGL